MQRMNNQEKSLHLRKNFLIASKEMQRNPLATDDAKQVKYDLANSFPSRF